jgi:hypothetical protein
MSTLPDYCHTVYSLHLIHLSLQCGKLGRIWEKQSYIALKGWCSRGGAPSARMIRRLVNTRLSSPEPGRDTGYMVNPPGSQHQLKIGVWSFRHDVQGFRQQPLFEMTLLILRGSVFPSRRYVEGCMKVICGREDRAYVHVSPWHVDIARPVWNGPWNIHSGLCNTGGRFCSLKSPSSA